MAVFEHVREQCDRLDFRLLRDHPVTLYHKLTVLDEDLRWLEEQEYKIHRFTASDWTIVDQFHDEVSRELEFPAYYGRNLDAFEECLADLQVPHTGGVALVFIGLDKFAARHPGQAWDILDILASRSRRALLFGGRLLAIIQSDDPRIQFEPVGSTPVGWNSREWLNKDRGLQGAS